MYHAQIAFLTRRVMLPPPAPPQWALERFLEGQKEAIARHAEAARAKAEADAWEAEWNAAEPLTPQEGEEGNGNEESGNVRGAGFAARGENKGGTKEEESKKDAVKSETIAERVHRKEVEFMARSSPLVVISLGLSGRSLALPQVKVLAKGTTRAVALASLDLRHNPFEHDEEVYDEVSEF
jgi:hypothetical protein